MQSVYYYFLILDYYISWLSSGGEPYIFGNSRINKINKLLVAHNVEITALKTNKVLRLVLAS